MTIPEYSDMCDVSRSALLAKNHGQEAVDDYMEFHDELDNFEVIAKRLAFNNHTAASGTAKKTSPGTSSTSATTFSSSTEREII